MTITRRSALKVAFGTLSSSVFPVPMPAPYQSGEVLIHDTFSSGDLNDPRQCDVGALRVRNPSSKAALLDGKYRTTGTGATRNDPTLYSDPLVRTNGLALMVTHTSLSRRGSTPSDLRYGFHSAEPLPGVICNYMTWIMHHTPTGFCAGAKGVALYNHFLELDAVYQLAVILTDTHAFFYHRRDNGAWIPERPISWLPASTLYAGIFSDMGPDVWDADTDNLLIKVLPDGVWQSSFGPAETAVAGVQFAGTVLPHERPDDYLTMTINSVVGTSQIVRFRVQDSRNYWRLDLTAGSALPALSKVVDGSVESTYLATGNPNTYWSAYDVTITTESGGIVVRFNGYPWLTANDTAFDDAMRVEIEACDGRLTDVAIYAREISSDVLASLNAMEAESEQ